MQVSWNVFLNQVIFSFHKRTQLRKTEITDLRCVFEIQIRYSLEDKGLNNRAIPTF